VPRWHFKQVAVLQNYSDLRILCVPQNRVIFQRLDAERFGAAALGAERLFVFLGKMRLRSFTSS
jgi:hypothetical protein